MAGIDKTYLHNYKDYAELKTWCENCGTVTDDYGNKFRPVDFLINITEDDWNDWIHEQQENALKNYADEPNFNVDDYGAIPIWNTPTYFDVWLIRNCPFEFIQNRLKEQYESDGWSKTAFNKERSDYEAIKNHDSIYDHFNRNGIKNPHFNIKWQYKRNFKDKKMWWWISVDDKDNNTYWYNDELDYWVHPDELHPSYSNVCTNKYGSFNYHKVKRMLNKWNLPEGAKVRINITYNRYEMYSAIITVKK